MRWKRGAEHSANTFAAFDSIDPQTNVRQNDNQLHSLSRLLVAQGE